MNSENTEIENQTSLESEPGILGSVCCSVVQWCVCDANCLCCMLRTEITVKSFDAICLSVARNTSDVLPA